MTSSRIGAGAVRLHGPTHEHSVISKQGTLRFALFDPRTEVIVGLDATAYQLQSSPDAGLSQVTNGNNLVLFVGTYHQPWALWIATGAGQLRIKDRPEPDVEDPHRYSTEEQQLAGSVDLYRAAYGKIEGCILWRRLIPEQSWRQRYALRRIEAWQFELGFKFLDW